MGKRRKLLSWKQAGHILRQRSRKDQDISRERMGKGKSDRMQGLAADVPEVGIVEKVPGKGMADIFHMDTDLVGASCLQPKADIG